MRLFVLVLSLLMLPHAVGANLPAAIKDTHPRLYVAAADLQQVQAARVPPMALINAGLTAGSLQLKFVPGRANGEEQRDLVLFGVDAPGNTMMVRHIVGQDTPTTAAIQVGVRSTQSGAGFATAQVYHVNWGTEAIVEVSWSAAAPVAKLNGVTAGTITTSPGWRPDAVPLRFSGRRADRVTAFEFSAPGGAPTAYSVDLPLEQAWFGVETAARKVISLNTTCLPAPAPVGDCEKIVSGGRRDITDAARAVGLAYLLTGDSAYVAAARGFADRLLALPVSVGDEWSRSSRVGAMGFLYDYLNLPFNAALRPDGTSYADALAASIKATVRAADLVLAVCGTSNPLSGTGFSCSSEPDYLPQYSVVPSTQNYYVTGHTQSAVSGMALGLLAVATEHPDVEPMVATIFAHFQQGFLRARDEISGDGGHHTGFAYGAAGGELGERMLMWNRVLDLPPGTKALDRSWLARLVYPFIYGLRADGRFPASGDNFSLAVQDHAVGLLALHAAVIGDPVAQAFYEQQVLPARGGTPDTDSQMWERLLFPYAPAGSANPADLSANFGRSGQVLMRDSWDYKQATVAEFKSTPFISENHHHLDQNSFTVFFRAPLLIDSGVYETYGSSHFWNYYIRSVAHNTVTVQEDTEPFTNGGTELSIDGGQWFGSRPRYPTIEQIMAGGTNALDGIGSAYENGLSYTYVAGDASKAYQTGKLLNANGFVRSMVFLRNAGTQPTIVVFDAVRTVQPKVATSRLHMSGFPVAPVTASGQGSGHSLFNFAPGQRRIFTVRHGEGMLTAQVLLPQNAVTRKVGGTFQGPNAENGCAQVQDPGDARPEDPHDCRFVVRRRVGPNSYAYANYRPLISTQQTVSTEFGLWRVEIEAPASTVDGSPQYFLNVLNPALRDANDNAVASVVQADIVSASSGTAAVQIGSQIVVLFNKESAPAAAYEWNSAVGPFLATGLKASTKYRHLINGTLQRLEEAPDGSLQSTEAGIVASGIN